MVRFKGHPLSRGGCLPLTHKSIQTESHRRKATIRRRRNEEITAWHIRATEGVRYETRASGRFYPRRPRSLSLGDGHQTAGVFCAHFYADQCPGEAIPSQLWGPWFIVFLLTSCKVSSITSPEHTVIFKVIKKVPSLLSLQALLACTFGL